MGHGVLPHHDVPQHRHPKGRAKHEPRLPVDPQTQPGPTPREQRGPPELPRVASFQIDRGRFENDLRAMCERDGVTLIEGVSVRDVELGTPHTMTLDDGRTLRGTWLIDATGRRRLLARKLENPRQKQSADLIVREVDRVTSQITEQMGRTGQMPQGDAPLTVETLHQAYTTLATNFDYQNGGTGTAPKFPQAMNLEVLLRYYRHGYNDRALEMVDLTLEKMARGGIYDQIAGGFARYSTDAYWLVPHFEKMLYDNALLARLYLHAHQATGRGMYRRIAEETLDYILREMTGPES
ncbi:MAG: tryptophan 7-halogenase, partial [Myxococcales bacterium]|nr:tryptophan 7-halogenase [Myxococcales bacterium]